MASGSFGNFALYPCVLQPLSFALNSGQTSLPPSISSLLCSALLCSTLSISKVFSATMEEVPTGKRRRVHPFDPNAATYATFYRKYIGLLLPALIRATKGSKTAETEKIVRFEVDMALVSSIGDFKWSRALKHKLEEGEDTNSLRMPSKRRSEEDEGGGEFDVLARYKHLGAFSAITRPIVLVDAAMPREDGRWTVMKRVARGEEELACRIRILCRIMPGGGGMRVRDLLYEVESYVGCLQLQVDALKSLVDAQ